MPNNAILDNFNRADATTLGASWGEGVHSGWTSFGVVTNQAQNSGQWKSNYWLTQFDADQEVFATISSTSVPRLLARIKNVGTANVSAYEVSGDITTDQIYIVSMVNEGRTQIGATISQALNAGDGLWMTVIGSEIKVYHRPGAAGAWTLVGTRTDTTVAGAGYIGMTAPDAVTYTMDDFGGGSISSGTAPAQNANASVTIGNRFRQRILIQETGGANLTTAFKLQVSKNGGAYADVVAASGDVRVVDSPMFAHGDATTTLLTGGTGTFVAGQGLDTSGTSNSMTLTANNHTEFEWSLQLVSGVVGDTFDLRVVRSDGTALVGGYAVTPRITAA